ncbi:MAG: CopG family transcriptional regulator [Desulfurococcaceae archaeon]|jgi:predicted DNA-binding protein|nr:CopG family transcriptional regulator [Desulfurococcaceae archaeon]MCC6057850.1 CopG family transcriptional regulator [Desulfurococcaceae archaeon]
MSSVVLCIRIPKELKERMQRLKGVNWSELIRKYVEETVSRYEIEELLKKIEEDLENVPELPSGTVARWIRIDRESH